MALELHDEVGQTLTGVVLGLDGLGKAVPPELRPRVETMQDMVRQGAEHVRDMARGLRPESLEEFGLRTALVGLLSGVSESSGLRIRRHIAPHLPALSPEAELVVYRVAQESLTNIVRHARATTVDVAVEHHGRTIELRVSDDGRGIGRADLASPRGCGGCGSARSTWVAGWMSVGSSHTGRRFGCASRSRRNRHDGPAPGRHSHRR